MIDIVIPPVQKIDRFYKNKKKSKNIVLRGKIVSVRKARFRVDPKKPREKDDPNSKTFIILVKYNTKTEDLLNKAVEIRVI